MLQQDLGVLAHDLDCLLQGSQDGVVPLSWVLQQQEP